ncbi:MAG: hypothetical protein ABF295_10215 [Flavobacteriaceae bacterium]
MKRTVITVIAGSLILLIWNALSWMVLPFHEQSMSSIPESAIKADQLKEQLTEDGVYHYPGMPEENTEAAMSEVENKLAQGPRITLMVYKAGGTPFMDPINFLWDFIFGAIVVILIIGIINKFADKSMKNIVFTTITIGLVVGFMTDLPLMNWFMFPLDYTMANLLDYIVSLGLLGIFMGSYTFKQS